VSNNVVYIRSTCTSGGFIPAKQFYINMFPSQMCNRWITSRKTLQSISGVYTRSNQRSGLSTTTSNGCEVRKHPAQCDNMMEIGSRRIFNSDHDIFRTSVRKFWHEEVLPHHPRWEAAGHVDREVWLRAGEAGLLGVDTPEEHGGAGGTFLDATITMEEQAYVNCSGPGFDLHSNIVMPYITNFGSPEQIEKFIPPMVAGTKIGAIAMTEPGAGSDLQGVVTNAKKDGDDWILNGSKTYITNGHLADVVIVVAVTNPDARSKAHGISLFLVEDGMPGFKKGRILNKMGLKAQDTSELFFEDVRLPASALLGNENHGFYMLMQELPQERLMVGIGAVAHCEWMFETTREYVKQRKAFGKTIAGLQVIQHKLAEIKTEISVMRSFIDNCLEMHSTQDLDGAMASMAKYITSDLQNKVAYDCVQMHGGAGFMTEYPICRAYMDARVQPIYGGPNEIMKELIARTILS